MYGPTETTVWSSAQRIEPGEGPVLIGAPILNTVFYIVDKHLQPVPIGVFGELLIGGAGLARGYLNRPELDAERFVRAPFLDAGDRLYRTGDLTRFYPDGRIEFMGRLDLQVKIRGYRIELEEIEKMLSQHEDIKEVTTLAWENEDGDKRLVAYYIPLDGKSPKASALREFIQEHLPDYMCPSFFVEMPTFPRTPNGKVDRKAFPKPDSSGSDIEPNYVPPQRELELQLAAIWRSVLKTQRVGIDDDFFELGGHSLLAAHLFAQIERKLGVNIPLAILFRAPTIRKLAEHIEQKTWRSIWSSLVPIQPHGARPPLFLIHGAEGNVLLYRNLARKLGNAQPVYGLQSAGVDGTEQVEHDFGSMAAKYIEEIKSVQSTGPYYLGGYCLGGTIALEMAQRLKKAGESVALLAMIETYNVGTQSHFSFPVRMIHKLQNICYQIGNVILSLSDGSIEFFTEKLQVELSRCKVQFKIWLGSIGNHLNLERGHRYNQLKIRDLNHDAQMEYSPKLYEGEIVLFKPRTHFLGLTDRHFGWGKVARDGVQVVEMTNYPRGGLNEPFVDALARVLMARIDKSLNGRS
jgi:acyl carrier protein